GPWLAAGAAALMAADNLMIVQGRIGTLEVYVVAAMICSMALYMRGHPLLAGATAGLGACMKLFALDFVAVMAVFELLRWRQTGGSRFRLRTMGLAAAATAGSLVGLLAVLDRIAAPYDNAARRYVQGGPFDHLAHMISYGVHQTGFAGPGGITSYPWQWLVDYKPIVYLGIDPARPGNLRGAHPAVPFVGLISP